MEPFSMAVLRRFGTLLRGTASWAVFQQEQRLESHIGSEMRRHSVNVVRRTYGVDVDRDDVETGEAAQQLQSLARGESAPGRRAHTGRHRRGVRIHVPGKVDWAVLPCAMRLGQHVG